MQRRAGLLRCPLWGLRLKWDSFHRSGDRKGPASPDSIRFGLTEAGCAEIDLTGVDAVTALDIPLAHKDPFDQLLLVQAQRRGLRLLTRDAKLSGHPLAVSG